MPRTTELHRTERIGWLRAAVLGANDGIVSTASLMVGVAAANAGPSKLLLTGAALPLLTALVAPAQYVVPLVSGTSLVFLTVLGALSARTGGAPALKASVCVAFWGALAMGLTAGVGRLFGTVV